MASLSEAGSNIHTDVVFFKYATGMVRITVPTEE